jgi:hypothetical protein
VRLFQNFSLWNSFLGFRGKPRAFAGFSKSLFHGAVKEVQKRLFFEGIGGQFPLFTVHFRGCPSAPPPCPLFYPVCFPARTEVSPSQCNESHQACLRMLFLLTERLSQKPFSKLTEFVDRH